MHYLTFSCESPREPCSFSTESELALAVVKPRNSVGTETDARVAPVP